MALGFPDRFYLKDGIYRFGSHKIARVSEKGFMPNFAVHDKCYSEVAENNGISIDTVKTQMIRAYAFLRKK